MAQKTQVILLDDLDGEEFTQGETVSFGLDGTEYEIDLNAQHSAELRETLKVYVEHARKVTGRGIPRQRRGSRTKADRLDTRVIRQWAADSGIELANRGRIPGHVIDQYEASGGKPLVTEPVKAPEEPKPEPKKPARKRTSKKPTEAAKPPVVEFSG